jgi:hypothetical protein
VFFINKTLFCKSGCVGYLEIKHQQWCEEIVDILIVEGKV